MPQIILVDDQPHVLRIIRMALERAGFSVDQYLNGKDAFEAITEAHPKCLITDIEMPVMSGVELCHRVHEVFPDRQFPIFVISSRTDLEFRDLTQDIPNLFFIEKPVSLRNLTDMIQAQLKEDN